METPCTTVTWASHTVTVPKVGFSTVPAGSTTSVVLVIPTSSTAPAASATSLATTSHCSKFKTITTVVPCDCETSLPTHPATAVSPGVARNYRQDIF
ncbi:hypothetical protein N7468_008578 [Penicillium chermesinum]|uniref:Uncharacterized protein n=1 Tax=Penicillium chermesinum TaxID=63820 RepID=A0A9W9NQC1_9EURO|nr:uncharacterized protein N7468_008578 [Penicillium chermesinum]KAJ5224036.1 hypothetical protein N7468_008578 [Penicillium chermesinum]